MKSIKLIILLSFFSIISCEDMLVETPKGFVTPAQYFNTEQETLSALYGVYDTYHSNRISGYYWATLGDLGTDVSLCRSLGGYNIFQHYLMENEAGDLPDYWLAHYLSIGAANLVISRTMDADLSDEFKNQVIAEAKFLRAYMYWTMILLWGDVPMWLDELNMDEVETLSRTPIDVVKAQIVADLESAAAVLPSTRSGAEMGRITKWAATGLLARVQLFDNNWQEAKTKAKEVIDNSPHSLLTDYADVFDFTNHFNDELVWVIPKLSDVQGSNIHSFSSPRGRDEGANVDFSNGVPAIRFDGKEVLTTKELFQGWGILQTIQEHTESFEDGDLRQPIISWHTVERTDGSIDTLDGGTAGKGYYNLKYIAYDENANNGSRDFIVIRLAELYLIYAEAENELSGPTADAYGAINTIRSRAFGDDLHDLPAGLSKEEFRTALINENRWELGGEGLRRWYLNHWGFDVLKAAVESVAGTNPDAAANLKPHHILFKIPSAEIEKNPNLIQNPGY